MNKNETKEKRNSVRKFTSEESPAEADNSEAYTRNLSKEGEGGGRGQELNGTSEEPWREKKMKGERGKSRG